MCDDSATRAVYMEFMPEQIPVSFGFHIVPLRASQTSSFKIEWVYRTDSRVYCMIQDNDLDEEYEYSYSP